MAIPHPFKTRRTTGSPTAGGNVHTLAQHMASAQAHPQYIQKGDEVGSANIADHELSSVAHRTHLLRRAELALTVEDFNSTKNVDPAFYDADHHTNIEVAYKTVITTALLQALMGSELNLDSGPLNFILHKNQMIHTEDAMNSLSDAVAQSRIPSMALIRLIAAKIADFLERSVADTLYASIDHDHDGVYALEQHTHSLYDVYVTVGGTKIYPARADHTHDDLYWRRDEAITSETDLSELSRVGIYPNSVTTSTNPEEIINLNTKDVQGHETFWIKRADIDSRNKAGDTIRTIRNFPATFVDNLKDIEFILESERSFTYRRSYDTARNANKDYYKQSGSGYVLVDFTTETFDPDTPYYHKIPSPLEESHDQIVATANLTTRNNFQTSTTLSSDETFSLEGPNPAGSTLCQSVLQTLVTNASIKEFDREGSTEIEKALVKTYKNSLHGIYTRNGYSFETALWIQTVLNTCLAQTPVEFYGTGTESDNGDMVSAIADVANQRFAAIFADYSSNPDTTMVPQGVTPGYMLVSGERFSGRKVRVNRRYFLEDAAEALGKTYEEMAEISDPEIVELLDAADPDVISEKFADYKLDSYFVTGHTQNKVVIHDLSTWILRGSFVGSAFASDNVIPSLNKGTAFVPFEATSKYLPYVDYFAIDDRYVGILDFVNPVDPSLYFIQRLVSGTYEYTPLTSATPSIAKPFVDIDGECASTDAGNMVGDYADLSVCPTGDVNIDPESRLLHGYLPIKTAGIHYEQTKDAEPQTGKQYYTWNTSSSSYDLFTGTEFEDGVTYYEKVTYNTVYRNDAEYFVMLNTRSSTGLNQFAKLVVGTHYVVGGPVGKDMMDHSKDLDASTVDADAASGQVYMRVAVTQHTTNYKPITEAEHEAGPIAGTRYFVVNDEGEYTEVENLEEFGEGVTYYTSYLTKGYVWSKKPVGEGTRYNSSLLYYSYGSGTGWNDITDEVEEDNDGNVDLQSNRVIFVDWDDVYQAAVDPELLPEVPAPTATNILQRGLFYQSFDMEWMPGKRYYRKTTLNGRPVFTRVVDLPLDGTPPYGCTVSGDTIYEVIDVERVLDIWCAIRELTSTGALQDVGSDTIVYSFGDSGNLITWDEWTRVITDRDELVKTLQSAGSGLIERLSVADSQSTIETIWSNSHSHSNKAVLDRITGHKNGTEYDYILIDMKRIALYSEVSNVFNLMRETKRAAVSGTQVVGRASNYKLDVPVNTNSEAFALKITLRATDPAKTLEEILRPASGYITLFSLSETVDKNVGVAGNINMRITPTGAVALVDPMPSGSTLQYTRSFTDLGKAICFTLTGAAASTDRVIAMSTAAGSSTTILTQRLTVPYGSATHNINYIWVHEGITAQLEWTGTALADTDAGIGSATAEAAKQFVLFDHTHSNKDALDSVTTEYDFVVCSGSSLDWAAVVQDVVEFNLSDITDKLPDVADKRKLHASFYLEVQSTTESLVDYGPVAQPGSNVVPVSVVLDVSNSKLRVKNLQSLCTTALTGTDVQKISTGTDLTATLHMRLSTRHATEVV